MRITVKFYNELRQYGSHLDADGGLTLPQGATPRDVFEILGLPAEQLEDLPLFRNGRPCSIDDPLQDGDALVTFAPMSGG